MQVILLRGLVLLIEVIATPVAIISSFFTVDPDPEPACYFYGLLIRPIVAEVIVSILSLKVKKFDPKPNLRIDFIFLIILSTVLFLGHFTLPCLFICSVIIILFEVMHIGHIIDVTIVMRGGEKETNDTPKFRVRFVSKRFQNSLFYRIELKHKAIFES
uniref:7TM_GPCR_Srx domain-containing protein n=1 Tax=Caenorhabditis tropicalis TaxID=1561998 RepID=A0A1I7UYM7_9PELO